MIKIFFSALLFKNIIIHVNSRRKVKYITYEIETTRFCPNKAGNSEVEDDQGVDDTKIDVAENDNDYSISDTDDEQ